MMPLFKTREQRRMDRDIEVRRGLSSIRRNIRDLERSEKQYLEKAKRAKQLGSSDQLCFLKKTLKRTAAQKRMMEKQLLNIETAMQIKTQAESHAQFAKSMTAVSRSISEAFGSTDLVETQREFEVAMVKAENLEQQMDVFLDLSNQSMFSYEGTGDEVVSDEEIDALIEDEAIQGESIDELDQSIATGLADVRRELGRKE